MKPIVPSEDRYKNSAWYIMNQATYGWKSVKLLKSLIGNPEFEWVVREITYGTGLTPPANCVDIGPFYDEDEAKEAYARSCAILAAEQALGV